jgi:hypothetical protein
MKNIKALILCLVMVLIIFLTLFGQLNASTCYEFCIAGDCSAFNSKDCTGERLYLSLHKDGHFEAEHDGIYPFYIGNWVVFGNAIRLLVSGAAEEWVIFAGTKSGSANLVPGDPQRSKVSISQAQGYSMTTSLIDGIMPGLGCWRMKKIKNNFCWWIEE